ncbi:putative glycoside hydrolase family 61 protein [Diaporthe ampelina]|uniref:lytic cellulose monooxygenase (C4-dehydrogenating) n=1 Tax=Diaporthe ampelina TaxID=1214573 RepID=A0A0G2FD09_9PEZI|nr:putative glycoside hydrolase family 61 protein [Diaporthe ampelina]
MASFPSGFFATALLVATAAAHSHIDYVTVNGLMYPGFIPKLGANNPAETVGWSQTALDDGFVPPSNYTSPDIICHRDGSPPRAHVPVSPGDKIHMQWNGWPASHVGPILSYLAPCDASNTNTSDGCASVDKTKLEFTKIDDSAPVFFNESGGPPGLWSTNTLIASNNSWLVGLPAALSPGAYVLRHELIALHYANRTGGGAQNYPQCVNLWVTAAGGGKGAAIKSRHGGGTGAEALGRREEGHLATEMYHAGDPGIKIDIYKSLKTKGSRDPRVGVGNHGRPFSKGYSKFLMGFMGVSTRKVIFMSHFEIFSILPT